METATYEENGRVDRAHFPRTLPGDKSRWADTGDRRWRRDAQILESVPSKKTIHSAKITDPAHVQRSQVMSYSEQLTTKTSHI